MLRTWGRDRPDDGLYWGSREVVKVLLAKGADIDSRALARPP